MKLCRERIFNIIFYMKRPFDVCLNLFFALLFLSGCKSSDTRQDRLDMTRRKYLSSLCREISDINRGKKIALDDFIASLSIEEKVSQLFIENLEGDTIFVPVENESSISGTKRKKALIPGGFIFFSYNVRDDIEGTMYFTDSIRRYCLENEIIPPFLAIDQEGGLVNRLRILNGPLPSNMKVSKNLGKDSAYALYSLQATQMRSLGFDMNIAPVLEVLTPFNQGFLGERSFGASEDVTGYGISCVNGYENNRIGSVVKHFPGNTNTDPHTGLPEIALGKDELYAQLEPFRKILERNPAGILMSHARTSCLDNEKPACLSYKWVSEKLRNEFGFDGVIFSDDIFMGALSENGYPPEKAAVMAIEAGVDVIMLSEKRFSFPAKILVEKALSEKDFLSRIEESLRRVLVYKTKTGLLEYRRKEAGKNDYKLCLGNPFGSVEDRIVNFRDARSENIDLYLRFF